MTSRSALSSAVGKIAWGYLFLHLHINLGALDILPDWVFSFCSCRRCRILVKRSHR